MKKMVTTYWRMLGKTAPLGVYCGALFGLGGVVRNIVAPLYFSYILAELVAKGSVTTWLVLYLAMELLGRVLHRIGDLLYTRYLAYGFEKILNAFMDHTLSLPFGILTARHSGSIISSQRKFRHAFESLSDIFYITFSFTILESAAVIVIVFMQHVGLGVIFSSWIVIYCALAVYYGKRREKLATVETENETVLNARVADTLANNTSIVSTGTSRHFVERIRETNHTYTTSLLDVWRVSNIQWSVQSLLEFILLVIITIYCLALVNNGDLDATFLVAIVTYMQRLANNFWMIGRNIAELGQRIGETVSALEILEQEPEVFGTHIEMCEKPEISLSGVSYNYPGSDKGLSNIDLNITFGSRVGIVGSSGSGKTTLLNLLLGLKSDYVGHVIIGGIELRDWQLDALRQQIAVVSQDTPILNDTVRANIAFGLNISDEQITRAAQLAHADTFIGELASGYETILGERGVRVSGGQRQRIALARAFARGARIIILDEATSALDSLTERDIKDTLAELQGSATIIIVAHRMATIMDCTIVHVMNDGKIVESGTPEELAAGDSRFSELLRHQQV
jgi:ABC-type bacteriocin/lantibiotic exporter with double-glycine peptidase domain